MSAPSSLVLYVDDEEANRVVFEHTFKRDFEVAVAASGDDALRVLGERAVAVVVADQRMPKMTGNDLLRIVKERHPDVVRVIVTAYSDLDSILAAVNGGLVARYVVKPWAREELAAILSWAVAAHQASRTESHLHARLVSTERLITLGSIAAAVVHDLAQPITHVSQNAERLRQLAAATGAVQKSLAGKPLDGVEKRGLQDLVDELGPVADDLVEGGAILRDMVQRMRELTRAPAQEERVAHDPLGNVRYALSVCAAAARQVGCTTTYEGPAALPSIGMPAVELTQVLVNLITNAVQSFADGAKLDPQVVVRARIDDRTLTFTVVDNGVGMDAGTLAKIGKPFFTTRKEGTGLGVAQCRRLVERVGGALHVESTPGKGTTVSFTTSVIG